MLLPLETPVIYDYTTNFPKLDSLMQHHLLSLSSMGRSLSGAWLNNTLVPYGTNECHCVVFTYEVNWSGGSTMCSLSCQHLGVGDGRKWLESVTCVLQSTHSRTASLQCMVSKACAFLSSWSQWKRCQLQNENVEFCKKQEKVSLKSKKNNIHLKTC